MFLFSTSYVLGGNCVYNNGGCDHVCLNRLNPIEGKYASAKKDLSWVKMGNMYITVHQNDSLWKVWAKDSFQK